ncbi:glycerophosphodiester phosphodiesterase [Bacillaceae bacterium W0354]
MEIFAHRGASKYAPENTMPAFKLAKKLGADGIELDVQLTKDDVPVIIHDENIRRTTNGTGFVQDYTLEQLKQLDAGYWFSRRFIETPIVSLQEFLDWFVTTNLLLNVELKTNVIEYPLIEKYVLQLIHNYEVQDRTIISSFNPNSIKRVRELDPKINLAWLTKMPIRKADEFMTEIGANQAHVKARLLSSKMVKHMIQHDIPLRVYTVNRLSTLRKCMRLQVDGIFTDVPDIMKNFIQTASKS